MSRVTCRSSVTDGQQKRARPNLGRFPAGIGAFAIAFASAALVVGGIVALRDPVSPSRYAVGIRSGPTEPAANANLARELARCRTVTETSADADCHAAWEAHRRRFFGSRRTRDPQER